MVHNKPRKSSQSAFRPINLPGLNDYLVSLNGFVWNRKAKEWCEHLKVRKIQCVIINGIMYPSYHLVARSWKPDEPLLRLGNYLRITQIYQDHVLYPIPDYFEYAVTPDGDLLRLYQLRWACKHREPHSNTIFRYHLGHEGAVSFTSSTIAAQTYAYWKVPEAEYAGSLHEKSIRSLQVFQHHKETGFIKPLGIVDQRTQSDYYAGKDGFIYNGTSGNRLGGHTSTQGYLRVTINLELWNVHRLVAYAFCPIPQDLLDKGYTYEQLVINHKDGNKQNNVPENLEWCTIEQNTRHAIETGLIKNRRLSLAELELLYELHRKGWSRTQIAEHLNVCYMTVVHHVRRTRGQCRSTVSKPIRSTPYSRHIKRQQEKAKAKAEAEKSSDVVS